MADDKRNKDDIRRLSDDETGKTGDSSGEIPRRPYTHNPDDPCDEPYGRYTDEETQPGIDADGGGTNRADSIKSATSGAAKDASQDLAEQLAKVRSEFLYLYADFENYKKNAIKERSDLRKYGSERLVVDLLGVLDIFETALSLEPNAENMNAFRKGIEMTAQELKQTLHRNGVEEQPALGAAFNPTMHEALSSEETAEHPPGHISRVFKKPYKLHDRVVRPGQVVVAKPKS